MLDAQNILRVNYETNFLSVEREFGQERFQNTLAKWLNQVAKLTLPRYI